VLINGEQVKNDLKALLWTEKVLGGPLNAGPVKAWKRKEVKKVEATPAFRTWLEQRRAWLIARDKIPADAS